MTVSVMRDEHAKAGSLRSRGSPRSGRKRVAQGESASPGSRKRSAAQARAAGDRGSFPKRSWRCLAHPSRVCGITRCRHPLRGFAFDLGSFHGFAAHPWLYAVTRYAGSRSQRRDSTTRLRNAQLHLLPNWFHRRRINTGVRKLLQQSRQCVDHRVCFLHRFVEYRTNFPGLSHLRVRRPRSRTHNPALETTKPKTQILIETLKIPCLKWILGPDAKAAAYRLKLLREIFNFRFHRGGRTRVVLQCLLNGFDFFIHFVQAIECFVHGLLQTMNLQRRVEPDFAILSGDLNFRIALDDE